MSNTNNWLSALQYSVYPPSCGGLAHRAVIAGVPGCGKTAIIKEVFRKRAIRTKGGLLLSPRIFGYWPFQNDLTVKCNSRTGIANCLRDRVPVMTDDEDVFLSFMPEILKRGNIVLVIDEAQELFPVKKADPDLIRVLKKGRNNNIGMLMSTPRPTECATGMLGASQCLLMGRVVGQADIGYSKKYGIEQPMYNYCFQGVFPHIEKTLHFKSSKYRGRKSVKIAYR